MPHIVVADPIHPDGIERLASAPGVTLDHPGTANGAALADRLRHADGLIVRGTPVDEALLAKAERLSVVCRHGVGYDLVDVPALSKRGIALMITPEANAASVAEHALMLMLNLARNVGPVSAAVRRGEWRVRGQSSTFRPPSSKVPDWPRTRHSPRRTAAHTGPTLRARVSISISACSATEAALASGVIISAMPRRVRAGTSTRS